MEVGVGHMHDDGFHAWAGRSKRLVIMVRHGDALRWEAMRDDAMRCDTMQCLVSLSRVTYYLV